MFKKIKSGCEYLVWAAVVSAVVFHLNSKLSSDASAADNRSIHAKIENVNDTIKQNVDTLQQKTR